MRPRVTIVDYGLCNIDSIARALDECGGKVTLTRDPRDVEAAERLILPGVGSFPRAMQNLTDWRLVDPLRERAMRGTPFLGICLGMQLMGSLGTEHSNSEGLGLLSAEVLKLEARDRERVPHIGWNEVQPLEANLFKGIEKGADFYFVHSFHVVPRDPTWVAATTAFAGSFVSAIASPDRPIFGTQFHPEKSQRNGFTILRNFLAC